MRDYAELILDLRRHHCDAKEDDTQEVCEECAYDVIVADKSKFNGITDACTCGLMHRAADAIEELLDELTTIRKQFPRWTSVDDRLPEVGVDVLVTDGSNVCISRQVRYVSPTERFTFWSRDDLDLTHWMPLPASPKDDAG